MLTAVIGCTRVPASAPPPPLAEVAAARSAVDAGAPPSDVEPVDAALDAAVAPAPDAPVAAADGVRRFRGVDEDALLQQMATRPVLRVLHRFSSSTLVFHCDLGDGVQIAFKPARRGEHQWWKHEVLAYRLARVLGIADRVPPAVSRTVPAAIIEGFAHDRDLIRERDGTIRGVAIAWMPVLHHSGLHLPEARDEWIRWMRASYDIPPASRRRAGQIAALIAFDYLQGNFDRWNAANVAIDEHDDLVFRDNNRGWFQENLVQVERGGLEGIERIPAWLLPGIERATADAVRAEVRRDGLPFQRLERANYWAAYSARREALLRRVRAAIAEHGRERVLLDE
ncbi:MAG: hypothetical protein JWM10_1588 [Myxococcaceae bacterium]|nr:hypothetical protein [Myxococcaceae bacterium]